MMHDKVFHSHNVSSPSLSPFVLSFPPICPPSITLPLASLIAPSAARPQVDDASSFRCHISRRLAQRRKHTIRPQLALSFMITMGCSGFVLGPSLPAMWLPVAGSSATIGLHEVVVVTTNSSRLLRRSLIVGSVVVGGDICRSFSYSKFSCLFPFSFLCENLNEF